MTDRPGSPETGDDSGMVHDRESTTGIPRWVKLSVLIGILVAVLVVAVMLIGGGHKRPSHGPSGGDSGTAPPSSVVAPGGGGHVRPTHG